MLAAVQLSLLASIQACSGDSGNPLQGRGEPRSDAAPQVVGGRTFHVATTGDDANPGTAEAPFRTVQHAVSGVLAGDTIVVHGGTYDGVVRIQVSGAPGKPILLKSAGDGEAVITATLASDPCDSGNTGFDARRTLVLEPGVDHWTFRELTIEGGVLVQGANTANIDPYREDRSFPGSGTYDPASVETRLPSIGVDPADSVRFTENRIRGRGIYAIAARRGVAERNEIYQIACGTGPAVFLNNMSDGWLVESNHIHDTGVPNGSYYHYQDEGIRQGRASSYNTLENNLVEDLRGKSASRSST